MLADFPTWHITLVEWGCGILILPTKKPHRMCRFTKKGVTLIVVFNVRKEWWLGEEVHVSTFLSLPYLLTDTLTYTAGLGDRSEIPVDGQRQKSALFPSGLCENCCVILTREPAELPSGGISRALWFTLSDCGTVVLTRVKDLPGTN